MTVIIRSVTVLIAALAFTGCAAAAPTPAGQPAVVEAPAAATPTDAKAVVETLGQYIPDLKMGVVYTSADDPNRLLGRPNQYVSKVAFADSRVPAANVDGMRSDAIERGGSVEMFADEAGATARREYIQALGKAAPLAVEYDYISAGVLLRVSRELTPLQAREYETALAKVMGR